MRGERSDQEEGKKRVSKHVLQQVPPQILFLSYMAIKSEIVSLTLITLSRASFKKKKRLFKALNMN